MFLSMVRKQIFRVVLKLVNGQDMWKENKSLRVAAQSSSAPTNLEGIEHFQELCHNKDKF